MMRILVALVGTLAVAGCTGASEPPPSRVGPPAAFVAQAAGPDDVVVAHVDGRPVWGSCVAAQMRHGANRPTALRECIDFELLAGAAQARELSLDREVRTATRTALVSRLVEIGFEERHRTPEDLRDSIDKMIERRKPLMNRPEYRKSAYARVEVPNGATAEVERDARVLAERIAAALVNESGLFASHLAETANRIAAGSPLKVSSAPHEFLAFVSLDVPYAQALFAIPEVGRIAPPVRTNWGWDVIVLVDVMPAKRFTLDELAQQAFSDVRRLAFHSWVNQIINKLGVKIEIDQAQVANLDEAAP